MASGESRLRRFHDPNRRSRPLLDQPDFGHRVAPAVAAQAGFAIPGQRQLSVARRFAGTSNSTMPPGGAFGFPDGRRIFRPPSGGFWCSGNRPHKRCGRHTGARVKFVVMHPQRGVVEHLHVVPPRTGKAPTTAARDVAKSRRFVEPGVAGQADAAHQVRLARDVSQIVVKSARPGIGPIDDRDSSRSRSRSLASLRISAKRRSSHRRLLRVSSIVSSVRPRSTRDRLVPLDAQLHADALKQHVSQLEHAGPQLGGHRIHDGPSSISSASCIAMSGPVTLRAAEPCIACCSSSVS